MGYAFMKAQNPYFVPQILFLISWLILVYPLPHSSHKLMGWLLILEKIKFILLSIINIDFKNNPVFLSRILIVIPSLILKLPKFDGFIGSDLASHIDAFAISYVDFMHQDKIVLRLFPRYLVDEALKWFY